MAQRTFQSTINGAPWTYECVWLPKNYGWCFPEQQLIQIGSRQRRMSMLNTLHHETLHALFPDLSERQVDRAARALTRAVSLGMRHFGEYASDHF